MVSGAPQALIQVGGHFLLGDCPDRAGEGGTVLFLVAVSRCTMGTKGHLKLG